MLVYVTTNIFIILLGLFTEVFKSGKKENINIPESKSIITDLLFVIPSFLILFLISAFRGDFATDYNSYANLFAKYNQFSFSEIFNADIHQEVGYVLLNKILGLITDNEISIFIVTTLIILYCNYTQFRRYSKFIWLSVLMFITIGSFYTSFNIMRQILAASILFLGSKYLYERRLLKYIVVVCLAAFFHRTAIIMVIFYYILNCELNMKNFLVLFLSAIFITFYIGDIINIVQKWFYSSYTVDSYGMTGFKFTNVVLPIAIMLFTLFHINVIDLKDNKSRIWVNAVIYYAFFSILGLKVQMIGRIADLFAPYILLAIPLIISKIGNKNIRIIYMMVAIVLLFAFNFITLKGSGYDPFYFYWENE